MHQQLPNDILPTWNIRNAGLVGGKSTLNYWVESSITVIHLALNGNGIRSSYMSVAGAVCPALALKVIDKLGLIYRTDSCGLQDELM